MPILLNLLGRFWYLIPMLGLFLWGEWWHHETKDVQKDLAVLQAQFDGFKAQVKSEGEKAKAEAETKIANSERVNNERVQALQSSYADIAARYNGLRSVQAKNGGGSGGSVMPAVPDTARANNDAARDQQLLGVLQFADLQTAQLRACQDWISAQMKVMK